MLVTTTTTGIVFCVISIILLLLLLFSIGGFCSDLFLFGTLRWELVASNNNTLVFVYDFSLFVLCVFHQLTYFLAIC